MALLSKHIDVFSDGSYSIEIPEVINGVQLYQYGDDIQALGKARDCAVGGCPGVMILWYPVDDAPPDTVFDIHWQLYLYAINMEPSNNTAMSVAAISALMGDKKALMNSTEPHRNYLTGGGVGDPDPNLDKLRTFGLNTHAGYDDGVYVYTLTMNGNIAPPMKAGKPRPTSISTIVRDDYLILPETHRYLFLDCNSVQWKSNPRRLSYGPFPNGILRPWIGDNRIHTFFPLVSKYSVIKTPLKNWKKLPPNSPFPSPFRS